MMTSLDAREPYRVAFGRCGVVQFALSVLATVFSGCADDAAELQSNTEQVRQSEAAIIGGSRTGSCDWPEVVTLGNCTGTLVHPSLVVYAAHCGIEIASVAFGRESADPQRVVPVAYCERFPEAKLGNGTDIAFCALQQPVTDIEPARVLAGCERDAFTVGSDALVVGFGMDGPDGGNGTQRVGSVRIATLGDEVLTDDAEVDTCAGDSGGPLFLEIEEPDGHIQRRLAAITSSGSETVCGQGVAHYVNLSQKLAWLEDASGMDITPCFDGDRWLPSPLCLSKRDLAPRLDGESDSVLECRVAGDALPLSTCGQAYSRQKDNASPSIHRTQPVGNPIERTLGRDEPYVDYEIKVTAEDGGSGIKHVSFTLLDEDSEILVKRVDEVPPYGLDILRLPHGRYTFLSEASDFADNKTRDEVTFQIERYHSDEFAGCQIGSRRTRDARGLLISLALCLAAWVRVRGVSGGWCRAVAPQNGVSRRRTVNPPSESGGAPSLE